MKEESDGICRLSFLLLQKKKKKGRRTGSVTNEKKIGYPHISSRTLMPTPHVYLYSHVGTHNLVTSLHETEEPSVCKLESTEVTLWRQLWVLLSYQPSPLWLVSLL